MKILQINSVYNYGSTGRIVANIHKNLIKDGHSSSVIYGRKKSNNSENDEEGIFYIGNKKDFVMHLLLTRITDRHGFGSKNTTIKIIKKIEEINPDIILLHNLHGYYVNVEQLFTYLSEKNTQIVWLLHDLWPITGHSAHFENPDLKDLPQENTNKLQQFEYPASYILNLSKKNYIDKKRIFTSIENMTIVVPSKWMVSVLKKSFLNQYEIKTIHNGIDIEQFSIKKNINKKTSPKIILGVANYWTQEKGLEIFNELAESLTDQYRIMLVGVDSITAKKLNEKIIAIARTESLDELVTLYNSAYVFLNPTFQDNFPTTNIEALCCGTPVITFKTGGSPEAITPQTGVVTAYKSVSAIIKALENLETKKIRQEDCRKRGEVFSIENMYFEYQKLFNNIYKGDNFDY